LSPDADEMKMRAEAIRQTHLRQRTAAIQSGLRQKARMFGGMLYFVVIVGLPIVTITPLRQRLNDRIQRVYAAMGPLALSLPPAYAKVGQNPYPFPAEFIPPIKERPVYGGVFDMSGAIVAPQGAMRIGESSPADPSILPDEAPAERQPTYAQGKIEKESLDILLDSSPAVKDLVEGKNPALRFKTWAAAKMEEDSFWVDLTFTQTESGQDLHYIWQVRILSKKVTPLSHNARSLSNP